MPPADDDFDIYGEDEGFSAIKPEDDVSAPHILLSTLVLPLVHETDCKWWR